MLALLYEDDNDNEFLDTELELMSSSIDALETRTAPESQPTFIVSYQRIPYSKSKHAKWGRPRLAYDVRGRIRPQPAL